MASFKYLIKVAIKSKAQICQKFITFPGPEFEPSKILLNKTRYWELLKRWLEPVSTLPTKWKLCYRASDQGWSSSTFHSQCNDKGPTVTFIRVGEYIFGGYTDRNWRKYSITTIFFVCSLLQQKSVKCKERFLTVPGVLLRRKRRRNSRVLCYYSEDMF